MTADSFENPPWDDRRSHSSPKGLTGYLSLLYHFRTHSVKLDTLIVRIPYKWYWSRVSPVRCHCAVPFSYTEQGAHTSDAERAMPNPTSCLRHSFSNTPLSGGSIDLRLAASGWDPPYRPWQASGPTRPVL